MLLRPIARSKTIFPHSQDDKNGHLDPQALSTIEKTKKNYELTASILDMLIDKSPTLASQLLIVKKAFSKWYEHISQENIARISEMMNFKEKMTMTVRQEFKIILEQISYYLRSITERYKDKGMEEYYVKYLTILKKFHWNSLLKNNQKTESKEIQTELQYPFVSLFPTFPTQRSLERESFSTIQSPQKRSRDVDIQKYIETKEQNLELERKCDKLDSMLANSQEENMKLRAELTNALKEKHQLNQNTKKHLNDIEKLSEMLEKLKEEELERKEKEEKLKNAEKLTETKYRRLDDLKENLYRELKQVQQQVLSKELSENEDENIQKFFQQHYQCQNNLPEPFFKTQKKVTPFQKCEISDQEEQRMLLLQAKVLEEFMFGYEETQQEQSLKTQ